MASREARWHVIDGVLKLKCRGEVLERLEKVYPGGPGALYGWESCLVALERGGYVWAEGRSEAEYRGGRGHEVWRSSFLSIFPDPVVLATHPGPPLIHRSVPWCEQKIKSVGNSIVGRGRSVTLCQGKGKEWTLFVFGEELYRKDGAALYRVGPQTFVRVQGDSVWVVSDLRLELRVNVGLEEEGS